MKFSASSGAGGRAALGGSADAKRDAESASERLRSLERLAALGVAEVGLRFTGAPLRLGGCTRIVVDGLEDGPLQPTRPFLLETEGPAVVRGVRLLMAILREASGDCDAVLLRADRNESGLPPGLLDPGPGIRFQAVEDRYPAWVRPPDRAAAMVLSPETLLHVRQALEGERPLTTRRIGCSGEVKSPAVVEAHLGAPMGEVVRACGGPTAEECLIVHGGPAGGEVIDDPDTPVGKGTGDLLVLPAGHELVGRLRLPLAAMLRRGRAVCGGCGLCAGLCPARRIGRGIEPHRILRQVAGGSAVPAAVVRGALLCARCGLCALYACPHGLSPRLLHDAIRRGLEAQGVAPEGMVRAPPAVSSAGAADAGAGAWTAAVPVGVPRDRLIDRLGLRRYVPAWWADGRKTDPDRVELLLADLGPAGRSGGRLRVREGERVRAGQPLAAAPGAVALHASIDGRVVRVDDERIVIGR